MLTAEEIRDVSFKKARLGGYNVDEVNSFVENTANAYESLQKENETLLARVAEIQNKVAKLVSDKESGNSAISNADSYAEKTIHDAESMAAAILSDARKKADAIVADANNRIRSEKDMIFHIQKEAADIRARLIELYQLQIESLEMLPEKKEAEAEKARLNKKYPTDRYSDKHDESAPIEDSEFESIEDAVRDATAGTAVNVAAAAAGTSVGNPDASGTIQINKGVFERKFGKLKFGDNYDVKSE